MVIIMYYQYAIKFMFFLYGFVMDVTSKVVKKKTQNYSKLITDINFKFSFKERSAERDARNFIRGRKPRLGR